MHCKAKQVLRDPLSTNQGNGSEMKFVAEDTKSMPKIWMIWCKKQSRGINYEGMEDFNF